MPAKRNRNPSTRAVVSKLAEEVISCPYCEASIYKQNLEDHLQSDEDCIDIQRSSELIEKGMILCHKESPIHRWITHFIKDAHIEVRQPMQDQDFDIWIPLWFTELWFRANKSPVTGRLDCSYQQFLDTVLETINSDRRKGILEVQAKIRGIGYFDSKGSIIHTDFSTPIWAVRSSKNLPPPQGTKEDFIRAAGGLLNQEEPFQLQPPSRKTT